MLLEFFNDGLEVGQGTDSRQWRLISGPQGAAEAGQQKSRLNHFQGNAVVKPEASLALVWNAGAQRRVRQVDIEREHRGNIERGIGVRIENRRGVSHFFLRRAAVSCSLSRFR